MYDNLRDLPKGLDISMEFEVDDHKVYRFYSKAGKSIAKYIEVGVKKACLTKYKKSIKKD